MDWTQFSIFILTVVGIFLWSRAEARTDFRHVLTILDAIQKEMKDFHGKLERQDAEFKSHIINIHEKK